ncbi:MAG: tyrosine-protein phosphatase, partial [Kiritimatiellae bacterium]|nr:tyrosine-protein phosphatase [Kiritimatiellia bacterium]
IEEGDVVDGERFDIDGLAYTTVLDVESDGQDLGTVQLHRSPLSAWLANTDFETYSSVYGSKGTESRETPRYIAVAANGVTNTYMNLNTASNVTGTVGGLAYSFTTEDVAPRTLRIDTPASPGFVYNVRDVGSWPLESTSGKRMNQDVILRGGHLDGFVDATAEQRSASYLTSIGLKTEIDLRIVGLDNEMPDGYKNLDPDGADGSFAADNCSYYRFGLGWGSESGTQIGADADGNFTNQVRKTFSTLGSEGRLPAYFHCRIGTDRTGITGLLLLGLMGVEEEVLYRDYLMSNFANIGGSRSSEVPETFLRYILRGNCNGGKYVYDTKDAQYGVSVASRCRQYLQMCGVTDEEIGRITQALSGETPAEVLARVDAYEAANNFRTVSYVPYEGSSTTNAIHRFGTNGERILPRDTPTRDGYTFKGWDVENEQDTGNGTAVVYAKWESNAAADPLSLKWDNNAGDFRIANGGNWYIDKSDPRDYRTPRIIDDCTFEGNATVTLGMDEEFFAKSLYFGNWGSPATITVTNGTFEVANDVTIGHYGANAAFNIYDGEVTVKRFIVGNWGSHDNNTLNVYGGNVVLTGEGSPWPGTLVLGLQTESRGDMLVKDGTVTVNGGAKVGFSNLLNIGGPSADYNSSITIDGGSLAVSGTIDVADSDSGSGGGGGRVYVKSGSLSTTGDLNISASADSWGQVDITGGKATVGGTIRVGNNASAQHAVLNVAGGELDANEISVARQCDGTLYITDGGVVSANQIQKAQGAPAEASPKVFIDGGTIVAKKATGLFFASVDSVTIGAGGAAFDTAGYDVTIEACRGISGIGSFTKKGLGTLEVKADSFGIHCDWKVRGRIVVEAGTLKLPANQTIYCEGTQVADGASLNLNGSTIVVVTKKVVESLWTNAT